MTTIATARKFKLPTGEGWYVLLNSGYRFGPLSLDEANGIAAAINVEHRAAMGDMASSVLNGKGEGAK